MDNLKKLKAKYGGYVKEMQSVFGMITGLKEKSELTEDEQKKLDRLKTQYEDLKAKTDELQLDMEIAKDLADMSDLASKADDASKPAPVGKTSPFSGKDDDNQEGDKDDGKVPAKPNDLRAMAKALEVEFYKYIDSGNKAEIPDGALDEMRVTGQGWTGQAAEGIKMPPHMAAKVLGLPQKGFDIRGKAVGDNPFLTTDTNFPEEMAPPEFMSELLRLSVEPTFMFQRVRKVPTKTGSVKWPRLKQTDANEFGTISLSWINEGGEKLATEPAFDQINIVTHELAARTEVSRTLVNRSIINFDALLVDLFRQAIMHEKDRVIIFGDGSGKPLGVTETTGLRSVNRKTADDVNYEDLVDMEHELQIQHRAAAIWVMADDVIKVLRKKLDNEGRPLFVENVRTGAFDTLFGRPIFATHRLSLGNKDVILLDPTQYIAPIEQDVVIMRSEHRKIENNLIVYVVFIQCGGQFVQPRAGVELLNKAGTS